MAIEGLIRDGGNAYRLNNGVLEYTAILSNGKMDSHWSQVEFSMIDRANVDYCNAVAAALILQVKRDKNG